MGIFKILTTVFAMLAAYLKKPTSMVGIVETKEALIAINEIGLCCASKFKDGIQATDFTELYTKLLADEDFKAKIKAGYDNIKLVSVELKDLDAGEGLDLASVQVSYVEKFVETFKA